MIVKRETVEKQLLLFNTWINQFFYFSIFFVAVFIFLTNTECVAILNYVPTAH